MSVPAPFTVNGRTEAANGPTVCTTVFVLVSAIDMVFDRNPAINTFEPSRLQIVLCAPIVAGVGSFLMRLPVFASTTYQCGPSNEGTYIVFPSGEMAIRSQHSPS